MRRLLVILSFCLLNSQALDNGLARTPPMGWLTWERFRCNTDCVNDADNCISENLIKQMADAMVVEGYKDVGYDYIIIDDCWLDRNRTSAGKLQPDPKRFPSGMKHLADYVHSKGLKFGIYEDFGSMTCGGFPGSEFYMQMDAETFAEWGVDYVKFDGCYSSVHDMPAGYETMGFYLNKTGRPMIYSCEWPTYQYSQGVKPDYTAIRRTCNLWRNHGDIQDSWSSMIAIVEYYGKDEDNFSAYAGPGGWNDPDMVIVGNFGLSKEEERVQMAMWSILASPLIMSNDLRHMRTESKQLLQNRYLIQINQDPLGQQGTQVMLRGQISIWSKLLSDGSHAVAFLNTGDDGAPKKFKFRLNDIKLSDTRGYNISDAFTMQYMMVSKPSDDVTITINPHGVQMIVASPIKSQQLQNDFYVV